MDFALKCCTWGCAQAGQPLAFIRITQSCKHADRLWSALIHCTVTAQHCILCSAKPEPHCIWVAHYYLVPHLLQDTSCWMMGGKRFLWALISSRRATNLQFVTFTWQCTLQPEGPPSQATCFREQLRGARTAGNGAWFSWSYDCSFSDWWSIIKMKEADSRALLQGGGGLRGKQGSVGVEALFSKYTC